MIYIRCPRIHTLGDFSQCLPVLSGLYKSTGEKIQFSICNLLERFDGLKQLLCLQEMFSDVIFEREENGEEYINIHEQYDLVSQISTPSITLKYAKCLKDMGFEFEVDDDFDLYVPKLGFDYHEDSILIGDRWSSKEDPVKFDARRGSYPLEQSGILDGVKVHKLDYSKDLVYNCSLIKYNPNVFITTFTGIGILADLMKKHQYIVWFDDVVGIAGPGTDANYCFNLHYYKDRNSNLLYIKDFDWNKIETKCNLR